MLQDELGKRNGRIEDLLRKFGMDKSLAGELQACPSDEFESLICDSRNSSMDYLKDIIENA